MEEQIINIAVLVKNKLAQLPSSTSQPCIYKIPRHLFEVNEKAYLPSVVSIGPIHCNKHYLQATQDLKLQHLQCFLQVTSHLYSLEDYLRILRDNKEKARNCYAESVSLTSNEFIQMLLIDAIFVISYLMSHNDQGYLGVNLISKRAEINLQITRDLFLEENQLPFFVLQFIYDRSFGSIHPNTTFTELACTLVRCYFYIDLEKVMEESNIVHLVDLMRICLIPPSTDKFLSKHTRLRSSVTHLHAVGVRFEASESKNLLDITFINGVIRIPKFTIDDTTESIYRSILAFEQCHHYYDSYFNHYTKFLDELIKTPEDVDILVRSGIIENMIGNEAAVAHLFSKIRKEIPLPAQVYFYSDIAICLNGYSSSMLYRWRAILNRDYLSAKFNEWKDILKRDYFTHPWAIISLISATVLLILTLLQTIGTFTQH